MRFHHLPLVLAIAATLAGVLFVMSAPSGPSPMISRWSGQPPSQASIQGTFLAGKGMPIVGEAQPQAVDPDRPDGNPLQAANTVMTQGYGVGSHAPAATWGAIDLALDGDGDGQADPQGTWDAPIYATHRGTIQMTPESWPAGNHVWVIGERYKTGYAHLKRFAPGLVDGQVVERGQLIGYIGSSGMSSGPHLDYQVWEDGVNKNPLEFRALENRP